MLEIPGPQIAQEIIKRLKSGPTPKKILAAVLVGKNPVSLSFVRQKEKTAKELGVDFRLYEPAHTERCVRGRAHTEGMCSGLTNDDLRQEVGRIASQKTVGGVIVQLPLPEHINKHYVLNAIPREKDVDVLGERALGAFYTGRNPVLPPAVGVVEEILKAKSYKLKANKVAVVGLGFLVGKPVAHWLMGKCAEIYLLDQSSDLEMLKNADLVITGVGKPGLIKPKMLKDGASVIDFGYSLDENGKIRGDFDTSELEAKSYKLKAISYTPTPHGTGPILVAKLFENFYKLNADSS